MVLINFEQTSTDLNGSGSMGLRFKLELLKYHSEHEFDLATTLLSRLKIKKNQDTIFNNNFKNDGIKEKK